MKLLKSHPIRRRYFLLLEVIVALCIVSMVATPLLRIHFGIAKESLQTLRDLQLQLVAKQSFSDVREKLYTHEEKWLRLGSSSTGSLEPVVIRKADGRNESYKRTYKISVEQQQEKSSGHLRRVYRTLLIEITLSSENGRTRQHHPFRLFAERIPRELLNRHESS